MTMGDKTKNVLTKFKNTIRAEGDQNRSYYTVVEVLKKIKFKHKGKNAIEKPVFTVLFNVVESNLPMPANAYNPVFMFKRKNPELVNRDGKWVPRDEDDDYIGTPSPEQYFTLPDYDNGINADAVVERDGKKFIGELYLASMFLKTFDSGEVADAFIKQIMDDLQGFLAAITNYMTEKKDLFEWEGHNLMGATKVSTQMKLMFKAVASFTEKGGADIRPVREA